MSTDKIEKEAVEAAEEFGSESFKELLLASKESEQNMKKMLEVLEEIVYRYALLRLKTGYKAGETKEGKPISTEFLMKEISNGDEELGTRDYHEFIGEATVKIKVGIHKFISNLDKYPEANQRRAWLKTVIYRILASYLKKRWAKYSAIIENEEPLEYEYDDGGKKVVVEKAVSKDNLPEEAAEQNLMQSDLAEAIVKEACNLRSQPQNVLGYLFNRLIVFGSSDRKYNCDAKKTCEKLDGHSLFQMKNMFISQFYRVYGIMLSESVLEGLENKVGKNSPTEVGKKVFCYTENEKDLKTGEVMVNVRSLTNITNQINNSLIKKLKI